MCCLAVVQTGSMGKAASHSSHVAARGFQGDRVPRTDTRCAAVGSEPARRRADVLWSCPRQTRRGRCSTSYDRAFRTSRFSPILRLGEIRAGRHRRHDLNGHFARRSPTVDPISADVLSRRRRRPAKRCTVSWRHGASTSSSADCTVLLPRSIRPKSFTRIPWSRSRECAIRWLAAARSRLPNCWMSRGRTPPPDTNFGSFAMDAFRALGLHSSTDHGCDHVPYSAQRIAGDGPLPRDGPSFLGAAAASEPVNQSPAGGVSPHQTQGRDYYVEEPIAQFGHAVLYRSRSCHHESR